ncbi:MAG: response regulator transcription factor [Synechococcaceae cyanobacterium SM2_3_1]|nr:response regulator transcription factor [Synechococcaceae cyanobacterium SM2_3_1]
MAQELQVLLVEDDELFCLGLATRLRQEEDIKHLIVVGDGETALEIAQTHPLDGVILDVGLPGIGGVETCHRLKSAHPSLPVLVLTSHSRPALIAQLVKGGASGYCLKGIAPSSLVLALRSVIAGASWWDPVATETLRQEMGNRPPFSESSHPTPESLGLTAREQEILTLITQGKTNREIGELLYISRGTVRVHVHAILHKLGARDRTQAALIAIQQQWFSLSP